MNGLRDIEVHLRHVHVYVIPIEILEKRMTFDIHCRPLSLLRVALE